MNLKPIHPDPQLYVQVLENLDRAVIATDGAGKISLFNPAAQALTGISERQAMFRPYQDLFKGQKGILYLVRTALAEGRTVSDQENVRLQRPSTPPLPVSVSVSPLYDKKGDQDGCVIIIRDLSRLRELEEAVRHADRLSILGTLAAGLAHEIKNPLGGIKGAAQLLAMELAEDSPRLEYTRVMIREVERVNAIIEELMDLARPRAPEMSGVNLAKILGDIILFQKEAHRGKNLEFQLNLDPSIPPLRGDENLLTRLFLNLVKNAAEAIDKEGRVEISTKVAADYHLHEPGSRPVPLVAVTIRDNGKGIPAESLDQIFTPFFTSKTRGSGLGLATCQKIVGEHRGFMKVESNPNEGTVFTVFLPLFRSTEK